jgi:hypothetical protein
MIHPKRRPATGDGRVREFCDDLARSVNKNSQRAIARPELQVQKASHPAPAVIESEARSNENQATEKRQRLAALGAAVDRACASDRASFKRFRWRQHRVWRTSRAEIAQHAHFVAVKNIASGVRLRVPLTWHSEAETDLDEDTACTVYETSIGDEERELEARMRTAMAGAAAMSILHLYVATFDHHFESEGWHIQLPGPADSDEDEGWHIGHFYGWEPVARVEVTFSTSWRRVFDERERTLPQRKPVPVSEEWMS